MEDREYRRKSKRHQVHWKAAVVFDNDQGKPILHTQTENLSVGGAAIQSNYGDLTGSSVTLLLAPPSLSVEAPKTLKTKALVVSTIYSPYIFGYRHGLSFVLAKDNNPYILANILDALESTRPSEEETTVAQPVATLAKPSGGSRLAQLKHLVLAKQSEEKKTDPKEERDANVSRAIEKAYRYLKDFTDQLNSLKPAYAKGYSIAGVPPFDGLIWDVGRVDFSTRETSSTAKLYEKVSLNFRLSANKQVCVTREAPANEKLKRLLLETKIEFTTKEERNERSRVVRTTFVLPCEVSARLELIGNFDTSKLLLRTRNIERFGMMDHLLDPDAITDESLDELAGFILGEATQIGPLLLKNA